MTHQAGKRGSGSPCAVNSPPKKSRSVCSYGENCYRKNPNHFLIYSHPHLEDMLIGQMDASVLKIPSGVQTKLDTSLVLSQLQLVKDLAKSSGSSPPNKNCYNSTLQKATCSSSSDLVAGTVQLQSSPDMHNGKHSASSSSSSESRQAVSQTHNHSPKNKLSREDVKEKTSKNSNLSCQLGLDTSVCGTNSHESSRTNNSGSDKKQLTDKGPAMTSKKVSEEERQRRLNDLKQLLPALSNFGDPVAKLKAAEPYNFFLTTVKASVPTHSEPLSIAFSELLHPSLGDLESSLQINFMVDLGWLMANYYVCGCSKKPLLILHGEDSEDMRDPKKLPDHIKAVRIKPPSPFGHHHTKMSLLRYTDGSLRVVVSTANLIESDWENRTQGLWISPACPELPVGCNTSAGESPTEFKKDLLHYLTAYKIPQLQEWVVRVRQADFSTIRVCFVSSVPGTFHKEEREKWGHRHLGSLLEKHVSGAIDSSWSIVAQCSSIGSLGPEPDSWMCGELRTSMSQRSGVNLTLQSAPEFKVVYPSFRNVASSCDGLLGGSCLPYSMKTHQKQTWFTRFLHEWKSTKRHRSEAMPHIKTYTRVSPCRRKLAWFILTSANLSKAAWGSLTKGKKGKIPEVLGTGAGLHILSYEAGVLFLPKFLVNSNVFHLDEANSNGMPPFPVPYDLTLSPYGPRDKPWVMEYLTNSL